MRSSSWPLTPTNGLPARSSSAPGASPTNMIRAFGLPSANTRLVAVFLSAQPSKAPSASTSSGSDAAAVASSRALAAAGLSGTAAGAAVLAAAGGATGRAGDGERLGGEGLAGADGVGRLGAAEDW